MIRIRSCRQHNLKGISLDLPHDQLTVVTGVSGAGKSSLVIDTLLSEAMRRYIESFSGRSRERFSQLPRPDVDLLEGLSPALSVTEQTSRLTVRQTVGSQVEVSALLAILFARVAQQYSPKTGQLLKRQTAEEMVEEILLKWGRIRVLAALQRTEESFHAACQQLVKMGFLRLFVDETEQLLSDIAADASWPHQPFVVIDRLVIKEGVRARLHESLKLALSLGQGVAYIEEEGALAPYSELYYCAESGERFPPLESADFNWGSVRGACLHCKGSGGSYGVLVDRLNLDPTLPQEPLVEAVLSKLPASMRSLYKSSYESYRQRGPVDPRVLWYGLDEPLSIALSDGSHLLAHWKGLINAIETDLDMRKERSPFLQEHYVGWTRCSECHGERLSPRARAAKLKEYRFPELHQVTIESLAERLAQMSFTEREGRIAQELLPRIQARLQCLITLGLGYLSLDRAGNTLSVGEAQRVQLAGEIGADLKGVLYLLDEPARGLHASDVALLAEALRLLRDRQNTLIVVEQNSQLIRLADHLVELGPGAGKLGGEVVFQGSPSDWRAPAPLKKGSPRPKHLSLYVNGISIHNISDLHVEIPLGQLVGFCGVSGSGKSSLLLDALPPLLRKSSTSLQGDLNQVGRLVVVDQEPPPPSLRSMPATYVGVMTPLRQLYAQTPLARARGLTPNYFSLTTARGGRCESCEGRGALRIDLELLPPLWAVCDVCQGRRYHFEALQATWKGLSITDVLSLSIEEVAPFFDAVPQIHDALRLLQDLGLGYLSLGQPFAALSGGELQRLKVAAHLRSGQGPPTLFILDEPASGLHLRDIAKLEKVLQGLVNLGHSVWLIEHHLDFLAQADWIIELGPGAGPQGGKVIFEGTPQALLKANTPTGRALVVAKKSGK